MGQPQAVPITVTAQLRQFSPYVWVPEKFLKIEGRHKRRLGLTPAVVIERINRKSGFLLCSKTGRLT